MVNVNKQVILAISRVNSIAKKYEKRQLKKKCITLYVQEVKVSPTKEGQC